MKRVRTNGTGEIVEKKSRFIANVFDVTDEEMAVSIINEMKKKYWDARHNCSAFVIGDNNELQRFSDDGEPSGTAGKPILEILLKSDVRNCLVVVTRYFGGTLLGTGGLIRAYQAATKEGLEAAQIMEVFDGIRGRIETNYNNIGKIQYICNEMDINVLDTEYGENVLIDFVVKKSDYDAFAAKITDSFSGTVEVQDVRDSRFAVMNDKSVVIL